MPRHPTKGFEIGAAQRTREAMRARGWSEDRIENWFAPLQAGDGGE